MFGLPRKYILARRERIADQLYLLARLHGARRRSMCSVHCRDIQGREWLSAVLTVLSGQVLGRDRQVDVHWLSCTHVLAKRERIADQLYMQPGLYGS